MGYIYIAIFLFTNGMFWLSYFNAIFADPGIITPEIASVCTKVTALLINKTLICCYFEYSFDVAVSRAK